MKNIDIKFNTYSFECRKEIKYAIILKIFISNIKITKDNLSNEIKNLKENLFTETCPEKNKNLINLNFEEILKTKEFNNFLKESIDYDNILNTALKDYNENKKIIKEKKDQQKKSDDYLLDKYYCNLCHKMPKNILIKNCNHLILCEECIKNIKICPKCGLNINEYVKIFR
jgi:hypothetical protein